MAPNLEGAVLPGAAGLFTDEDIANHARVTCAVHEAGGRIAMQILHAGRYGYSPECVAPSPIKSPISPYTPNELDDEGIEKQISDIVATARRAQQAGYDGVEVMGSEGYFLNQFLVTRTNKRTDCWGGSFENRMRLPVETVRRVRQATGPNFMLIYRLSMIDLVPGGSNWAEVVKACQGRGRRRGWAPEYRDRMARSPDPDDCRERASPRIFMGHEETHGAGRNPGDCVKPDQTRPRSRRRSWRRVPPTWFLWRDPF